MDKKQQQQKPAANPNRPQQQPQKPGQPTNNPNWSNPGRK